MTGPPAAQIAAQAGRGIGGEFEGRSLRLGSSRWMGELGVDLRGLHGCTETWRQQGRTVSWLADAAERKVLGAFAFGDRLKPTAAPAVRRLHEAGLRTVLLTGDNAASAESAGRSVGIEEIHAEVLPADKAALVARLRPPPTTRRAGVAMVGDGVNDAPALAAADVGIAMGGGTDVAMATAGVTLMRADLSLVPTAISISRRTTRKIRQNLFWAMVYNVVGIPLAAAGLLSPMVAGAAMALSSVSVITSALLLRGAIARDAAR
jgi:Cu+-exporting ATPase